MSNGVQVAHSRCGRCSSPLAADAAFCTECGASTAVPQSTSPVLPGFEIVRTLGVGGAALVYLARQESLDRMVAIKILRHSAGDDDAAFRDFRREARTISRLTGHPNVVTVYSAGRTDSGQPFLVTEYMDRGSLSDVVDHDGPLPPAIVASIGVGVADALIAAHALGIHHRDVKPANVLLSTNGHIKLADFGIARLLSGQSVTTTDVYAFTPEHVAPEMLRREPDGSWSDVYGLASTLATALLGAPPVRRMPDERVDAYLIRKLTAPPPALLGVPEDLARSITRALDPEPARRPTMSQFRDELAAVARRLGSPAARRPSPAVATAASAAPAVAMSTAPTALLPPRPAEHRPSRTLALLTILMFGAIAVVIGAVALSGRDGSPSPNDAAPTSVVSAVATTQPASTQPSTTVATAATVVPSTAASTSTAPPTTSPQAAGEPLSKHDAEAFLNDYYDAVEAGDYETSWAQLTPEFQSGKARSFDYYTSFWDANDIELRKVHLVESSDNAALIRADLRWNASGPWITDEFELVQQDGRWLIDNQQSVD
jgi:serine/threonine protein kinase